MEVPAKTSTRSRREALDDDAGAVVPCTAPALVAAPAGLPAPDGPGAVPPDEGAHTTVRLKCEATEAGVFSHSAHTGIGRFLGCSSTCLRWCVPLPSQEAGLTQYAEAEAAVEEAPGHQLLTGKTVQTRRWSSSHSSWVS